MEKKEMLQALIEYYDNGNKSQFAKRLGISAQGVSTWLSRGTLDIEAIYAKCENINPEWLLTGKGEMLKGNIGIPESLVRTDPTKGINYVGATAPTGVSKTVSYQNSSTSIASDEPQTAKLATQPGEGIPLIPIEAMAGALTSEQTVLEYECERYVVPMFKGADFLIPVKGSSMYPKYSSGDIVACQRVPMGDLFFQWNKVYVIDTNQGALIKRIKPGSDKDHVLIVSDNEKYDPFELPFSAIHAVALVIGVIRLE